MHAGRDLLVIPAEVDINYIVIYSNIPRVSLPSAVMLSYPAMTPLESLNDQTFLWYYKHVRYNQYESTPLHGLIMLRLTQIKDGLPGQCRKCPSAS